MDYKVVSRCAMPFKSQMDNFYGKNAFNWFLFIQLCLISCIIILLIVCVKRVSSQCAFDQWSTRSTLMIWWLFIRKAEEYDQFPRHTKTTLKVRQNIYNKTEHYLCYIDSFFIILFPFYSNYPFLNIYPLLLSRK